MMRQTGGTAVGEISTRSSPFCFAIASACGGGMMPSCWPVSSMTRISRTRMRSLTRTRSSRRGPAVKAINPPTKKLRCGLVGLATLRRDLFVRHPDEGVDGACALVSARAPPPRSCRSGRFALPYHEHVGVLLQLSFSNLIPDLLLPFVELDTQARRGHSVPHRRREREMPIRNRQHHGLHRSKPQWKRA